MFNMFSVFFLLSLGFWKLLSFLAQIWGSEDFTVKFQLKAERANQWILFFEGEGPRPSKSRL